MRGFRGGVRLAVLLALLAPIAVDAQSSFGAAGLGLRIDALDARLRAMGAVGPGSFGPAVTPDDPAATARLVLPTITGSMQPSWGSLDDGGAQEDLQGVRFPAMGLAYPLPWFVLSATYGSYLDQRWAAERSSTFEIGGETLEATDRFESRGGIATFRLGAARALGERAAVGVSIGRHTGRVTRAFARGFDTLSASSDIASFTDVAEFGYSGTVVSLGANVDPLPILRVGASLTWNGTLTAESRDEEDPGPDTDFDLPTEFRLGASARLTPRLALTAGVTWADWSGADGGVEGINPVGTAVTFAAGLEATGVTFAGRTLPLRLGYRRADLPYRVGEDDAVESALAAGLGLRLAQAEDLILAGLDLAVERGGRTAGALDESFWRMTVTLRVSGG